MKTPSLKWRSMFHVTHRDNVAAIRLQGLLPSRSRGQASRVWLADLPMLPWAINHVCECHGWQRDEVTVIRVSFPAELLRRRTEGVFYCNIVIPPAWLGMHFACQRMNKWPHGTVQTAS